MKQRPQIVVCYMPRRSYRSVPLRPDEAPVINTLSSNSFSLHKGNGQLRANLEGDRPTSERSIDQGTPA